MLGASKYTVQDFGELYCMMWKVELDIRSKKTHIQMERLHCRGPAMVHKEIYAHMIVYNLMRSLIVYTSIIYQTSLA